MLQCSCLENPPPWQRSLAGHSLQGCRVGHNRSNSPCINARHFSPWQLCPSESWVWRWLSCLACGDPGGIKCAGTRTASASGVMALSVFFGVSCSWWSEGLLGQCFSVAPPIQARGGLPCLGSYSVVKCLRCLMGQPLYCSAANAGVEGERLWWWLQPIWLQLSSITLLPWLSGFPPQALPTTISSFTSPQSISPQSIAALTRGLLRNS